MWMSAFCRSRPGKCGSPPSGGSGPTLGDPGGPRDAAVSPAVGASGGSAQSTGAPAAKLQLCETQPFVPVRIVKRILQGHFVEMAELSEENLGLELRRGSEEEEGKAVLGRRLKEVLG